MCIEDLAVMEEFGFNQRPNQVMYVIFQVIVELNMAAW